MDIDINTRPAWNTYIAVSTYHYPITTSTDHQQRYPKAKRFKYKGWPHFDAMHALMLRSNTVKGKNLFRPLAERDATDNVIDAVDGEEIRKGKEKEKMVDCLDWPLSDDEDIDPVLRTAKEKLPTPPPALSKRKFSALVQSHSASPATNSPTPGPSTKRRHVSNITAPDNDLSSITVRLDEFTDAFRSATGTSVAATLESSPMCRRRAIRSAQELEVGLSDEHRAALVNIFIVDVNTEDAYMELKREGLRKAWVADRLKNML